MSILGDIGSFLTSTVQNLQKGAEQDVGGLGNALEDLFIPNHLAKSTSAAALATPPKKTKAKATKAKPLTDAQIEKAIQNDPFNQVEQSVTQQEQAAMQNLSPLLGGQNAATATSAGNATALASLGLGQNSTAAQWLAGATQQASQMNAPLIDAMNNYQALYAQSLGPVTTALSNLGSAEALQIATAPEETWLNTLAQKIPTEAIYNEQLPPGTELPSWLANLYGNLGVAPATKGTYGVTGATNALTPAGSPTSQPTTSSLQPTSSSAGG